MQFLKVESKGFSSEAVYYNLQDVWKIELIETENGRECLLRRDNNTTTYIIYDQIQNIEIVSLRNEFHKEQLIIRHREEK